MNYVVVDFEWNQAMRSDSPVFNRLPIHLRGEIIEIGAVRLNDDFSLGDEFTMDIKPAYFRQMHYKVKKLTGFDKERLDKGVSFPTALEAFREFCGEDVTFLTWGCDDQGIFEQNIIIHDLDWDWVSGWINLQLIYNVQTGGDRNQKALSAAMEHFGIEQTRVAHDALGDAYNTALVCTNLDMIEGLNTYDDAERILSLRTASAAAVTEAEAAPEVIEHEVSDGYASKAEAFNDPRIASLACPKCGRDMAGIKWINQGDGRYMNLYSCKDHGQYLVRVKFKKNSYDTNMTASRIVYEADDEMITLYREKSTAARRRGRSRSGRRYR